MGINILNYALDKKDWEKGYEDLKKLEKGRRNLAVIKKGNFITSNALYSRSDAGVVIDKNTIKLNTNMNGTSYLFDYIKVENGESFTIHADMTEIKSRVMGVAVYDENKEMIMESGLINGLSWVSLYNTYQRHGSIGSGKVDFTIGDERVKYIRPRIGLYDSNKIEKEEVLIKFPKMERGVKSTPWTPSPEDINAKPLVAELAEGSYINKQNEKAINELKNAVVSLGGEMP